jgi:hypothetical protein
MRGIGIRPYVLQPYILIMGYLGAREQLRLDLGSRFDEDIEHLHRVVDFWARLQGAYRADGFLFPGDAAGRTQILGEFDIAALEGLVAHVGAERYAHLRRMAATLELYCFALHGEQRDGLFGHGPYPLNDGSALFVKEFNDLHNDFLPWADTASRVAFPTIVVAYRVHDVDVTCDLFGSIVVEPHEIEDRLLGACVLAVNGDELHPLGDHEISEVIRSASDAQQEIFLRVVEWDDLYKVEYGGPLFANHVLTFFELAGCPDARTRVADAFAASAAEHAEALLRNPVPSIWQHLGTTEGPLFAPVEDSY